MFQLPNYILLKNIQWKKLCKFSRTAGKIVNRVDHMGFNPFVTNVHILYTLKTPENQRCFQGVWNGDICQKWVKYTLTHSFPMHPFSTPENIKKPWPICSQCTLSQHNFSLPPYSFLMFPFFYLPKTSENLTVHCEQWVV